MSKINKNGELDQYGAEHISRLIFATIEKSVKLTGLISHTSSTAGSDAWLSHPEWSNSRRSAENFNIWIYIQSQCASTEFAAWSLRVFIKSLRICDLESTSGSGPQSTHLWTGDTVGSQDDDISRFMVIILHSLVKVFVVTNRQLTPEAAHAPTVDQTDWQTDTSAQNCTIKNHQRS